MATSPVNINPALPPDFELDTDSPAPAAPSTPPSAVPDGFEIESSPPASNPAQVPDGFDIEPPPQDDSGRGEDLLHRAEKAIGPVVGSTIKGLSSAMRIGMPEPGHLTYGSGGVLDAMSDVGQFLKDKAADVPTNPAFDQDKVTKATELGAGVLPYLNPAAVPIAAMSGYDQGEDEAAAKGETPAQQERAGVVNAAVQGVVGKVLGPIKWLEDSGVALSQQTLAAIARDITTSAAKGVVRGGAEGALQETGRQIAVGDDVTSKESLQRDLEAATNNALVGGVVSPGLRTLGIADQLQAKSLPTDAPVPEATPAIDFQMKQLAAGNRPAVMIAPGGEVPPAPQGKAIYENNAGTFIYDPTKISDEDIDAATAQNRLGDVLGYPTPAKPETPTMVQTLESPTGQEKLSIVADDETAPEVSDYLRQQAEPGDVVSWRTPEEAGDVIAHRQGAGSLTASRQMPPLDSGDIAENWIKNQAVKAAQTGFGKNSSDSALKVVSEWIRNGETPEGKIPPNIVDALMRSLKPTRDMETGETLSDSHPDWPRTGTLLNFLENRYQDRIPEIGRSGEMTPEQFDESEARRTENLRQQYEQQEEPTVRFSRGVDKTNEGNNDDVNAINDPNQSEGGSLRGTEEERARGGEPEAAASILGRSEGLGEAASGGRQEGILARNKVLAANRQRAQQELAYQDLADRTGKLHDDEGYPEDAGLIGQGVEHQVFYRPGDERVTKLTKAGEYGINIIGRHPSTPRSYLERLGLQNKLFGDDIRWEGISGDNRTITSQRYLRPMTDERGEIVPPTYDEISATMKQAGFRQFGYGDWYNSRENVLAKDAHPRNFIKDVNGKIHPIDLQLRRPAPDEVPNLPSYSRQPAGNEASLGLSPSEIARHLREVSGDWKTRPGQIVLPDAAAFPDAAIRSDIQAKGDVEGIFHKGKVYLFADKLPTTQDAQRVYLHETVGHYGLQKVLGPKFDAFLDKFYNDHRAALPFDQVGRDYGLDMTTPEGQREAVEEHMARLAESNPESSLFQKFIAQLKVLANHVLGTKFGFNEDEAKALLQVSRRALERGDVQTELPRFSRKGHQENIDRIDERLSDLTDQLNQLKQRGAMKSDTESVKRQIQALTMEKAEARAQMDDADPDPAGRTNDEAGAPARPSELDSIHPMRLTKAFLGTKDIFNRTKGLEFLGKAIERHVDTARKYQGELLAPFGKWNRETPRAERKKAYSEFAAYWGAKDAKQSDAEPFYQMASPAGKKLIDLWRAASDKTGKLNMLNKLVVWDPHLGEGKGGFRAVGRVTDYFPRTIREDVWNALKRPNKYPEKFEEVWRDLKAAKYAETKEEALSKINAHFGTETSNDHFGAIESARLLKLPSSLYDYSFEASRRYLMRWAERTAQIEAYGQKIGANGKDLFDIALNKIEQARKEGRMDEPQAAATGKYINAVRDRAYGKKYNGPLWSTIGVLNAIATGTQLANPVTVGINVLSGIGYNATFLGTRHALAGMAEIRTVHRLFNQIRDGVERGAIQDDLLHMVHDAVEAGGRKEQAAMKFANKALTYSGFNASEYFIRAHTLATAKSFLRTALGVWGDKPGSRQALQYAAWFQRNGFHVPDLIVENGTGAMTDKFLRGSMNDVQGGYRFDQVPVWMDSPLGKFFFKYQKWGSQMARNVWMNVMAPALTGTKVRRMVDGNRVETTVRDFAPLVRFAVMSGLIGWSQDQLKEWLFGRPDRTAGFHEIARTLDENFVRGLALIADKYFTHVINAGALGTIGNYLQNFRDVAERSQFKSPLNPPGLSTLSPAMELAMRFKEQGTLTAKDLNEFLVNQVSMFRAIQQGGSRMLGALDPSYKKQSAELRREDMAWLGNITRRYGSEIGQGGSRLSISRVGKNENTPFYDRINQALLLGDREGARQAVKDLLASRPDGDHEDMLKSLMASVRARQPIKIGLSNSESTKEMFLNWAQKRLEPDDVARIRDIDQAYRGTAVALGLMKPEQPASTKEIEKTLGRVLLQNDPSQAAEIRKAMGH